MIMVMKDIYHGREWSEMPKDEMIFMKKVAFVESISESTLQLIVSCLVLRSYGMSTDPFSLTVQITSFVMSFVSIVTCFGSVSRCIQFDNLSIHLSVFYISIRVVEFWSLHQMISLVSGVFLIW